MTQPPKRDAGPARSGIASDPHHGDLRKAAYLKRRAEYQMQATSPTVAQAGAPVQTTPGNKQAGRLR